MAITTYAELVTAVQSWLHRTDLASQAADFITLGEAHLNRNLRCPDMETTATVNTSVSDRYAALPARFHEAVSLDYSGEPLRNYEASDVARASMVNSAGLPVAYAVTSRIEFDRISDQAYAMTLSYVQRIDLATDTTNWLLTRHPDAYLFAALAEAAPFIRDDKRVILWTAKRDAAVTAAAGSEQANRPRVLRTEFPALSQSFNILRG